MADAALRAYLKKMMEKRNAKEVLAIRFVPELQFNSNSNLR